MLWLGYLSPAYPVNSPGIAITASVTVNLALNVFGRGILAQVSTSKTVNLELAASPSSADAVVTAGYTSQFQAQVDRSIEVVDWPKDEAAAGAWTYTTPLWSHDEPGN